MKPYLFKFFVLLTALFYAAPISAQSNDDSLRALAAVAEDSVAARIFNELCWENRLNNPSLAIVYGQKAEEIAIRIHDYKQLCKSYSYIGTCHQNIGNLIDAVEFYNKQIDIARMHGIDEQLAWGCNNMANVFCAQNLHEQAAEYLNMAFEYANKAQDTSMLGYLYRNMGHVEEKLGNNAAAMENYRMSLKLRETNSGDYISIANTLYSIAGLFSDSRQFDSALYYYKRCLSYGIDTNNYWRAAGVHSRLAKVYLKTGDLQNAEAEAETALSISKHANLKDKLKSSYHILGNVLYARGDYDAALEQYLASVGYADSIYNSEVEQRISSLEYNSSQYRKQLATEKLKYENQQQSAFNMVMIALVLLSVLFGVFMYFRRKKLKALSAELTFQREQVTSSIRYAQKLQAAILPTRQVQDSVFSESFALFMPKDIVSGNFYWTRYHGDYEMVAIVEFPSSGVAGGCLSMLGTTYLHELTQKTADPVEFINLLWPRLIVMEKGKIHAEKLKNGLSIGLLSIHKPTLKLKFVGIGISLMYLHDGEITIAKPCMPPMVPENICDKIESTDIQLVNGDSLYLSTHGYTSQTNPRNGECISQDDMVRMFVDSKDLPMLQQRDIAKQKLDDWRNGSSISHDICVLGMRLKKVALSILLILSLCIPAIANDKISKVDSLESLIENAPEEELPELYNKLAWEQRISKPFSGLEYSIKAIEWSLKMDNYEQLQYAYVAAGTNQRNLGHYDEALEYYIQAREVARAHNIRDQIAYAHNNIGFIQMKQGNYKEAETNFKIALDFGISICNKQVQAYAKQYLGFLYHIEGIPDMALEKLQESAEIWKEIGAPVSRIMVQLNESALIYEETKQYQKAKDTYYLGMKYTDSKEYEMLNVISTHLCQMYISSNQADSANYFAKISLDYAEKTGNYSHICRAYKLIIKSEQMLGNKREATKISRNLSEIIDSLFSASLQRRSGGMKYTFSSYQKQIEYDKQFSNKRMTLMISVLSLLLLVLAAVGIFVVTRTNRRLKKYTRELKLEKAKVEDNIEYAHSIQMQLQPADNVFGNCFSDKFLLYMPKDIVSGDFYWKFEDDECEMLAVADCTGHGVPGAMLTMLGTAELQEIALSGERNAGNILEKLRDRIKFLMGLNQLNKMQDGMDISLIVVNKKTMMLDFSGAYNSLIYIRNGEINQLKANRNPIGEYVSEKPFTSQLLQLEKGDCIYMMSDGYVSQFGGEENAKFPKKKFNKILLDNCMKPMSHQKEIFRINYIDWQGQNEQVDDVTLAGFRV